MRLTRIAIEGDAVVDLHPRLTLVRGLSADARQRFVDAIGGLPDGITRGLSGWVELDGERRDLGEEVFEPGAVPPATELVVRAGDLPGSDPALHRVSSRRADLGYERDRLLDRLEAARTRVRESTEECGRALQAWQVVHGGLPEVGADGEIHIEPPDGQAAGDSSPADVMVTLTEDEPEAEPVDTRTAILARIEEVDRALLPLDPVGPEVVLAALEAASRSEPAAVDADQDEAGPADPFATSGEDLFVSDPFADRGIPTENSDSDSSSVAFEEDLDPVVVAGRLRVAEARRALAAARGSQRSTEARSELVEALEQAHTEVVESHHRDRVGRARHKVEEARLTEQRLLDQLGFPSYTAYVLSAGAIRGEPEELAAAEARLAAAEAELERIVADRAAAADGTRRDAAAAVGLAGGPNAMGELRAALAEVGLVLDDVATDDSTLVALARSWLTEQETALSRREDLLAERAELEEQLGALPEPIDPDQPLSEVAALARAEADLLSAEAEVSGITNRLEEIAEETKDALAEEVEEADDGSDENVDQAAEVEAIAVEQRVDDVTWYITTRLAALRGVDADLTLPILLDDPFVDFEVDDAVALLGSVEAFGGAVQIVLLTEDPDLIAWTEGLGTDRGWVVAAGQ